VRGVRGVRRVRREAQPGVAGDADVGAAQRLAVCSGIGHPF
jgi:hypothetical protein